MKYTIKTFLKALVGETLKEWEDQENNGPLYFKWDGCNGILYTKSDFLAGNNSSTIEHVVDEINLQKERSNRFIMELSCKNYWYITIEFFDGGPRRNKEYKLSDYIK